jgi:hypothetical protein
MADVYKIAVALSAVNGISPVLAVIAADMIGLHGRVAGIGAGLTGWTKAMVGFASVLGGAAILGSLAKIASHGKELLDQQEQLVRAGLDMNDVLKLQADYYDRISKIAPISTAAEYEKTVRELRAVTGSTAEAVALAPKALMVDALLSNTFGHEVHGEYYKLSRSAEMKGISTDQKKLDAFTDQFFSYIVAFGGKLKTEDVQALARRGGSSFINAKPESLGPLAVLAADLGGSTAGTASMTLQQLQLGANTLSKQQAETLAGIGLLDMSKAKATGFGGGRLQLQPGAMVGSLDHGGDIPGWIKDTVWPAIQKAAHGDKALEQSLLAKIAPNRNAQKLIQMYGDEGFRNQISKDLGLAGQVKSIPDAYQSYTTKNPKGVEAAFTDQFSSMMAAIGAPVMQAAMPVMASVTSMFESVGAFANANPEAFKVLAYTLAGVAAALIAIPVAALASMAGIPLAIAAVVSALGALAVIEWDKIRSGLLSFSSAFDNFLAWLAGIAGKVSGMFSNSGKVPSLGNPAGDSTGFAPTSFSPGMSHKISLPPTTVNLNIDGARLAQSVAGSFGDISVFSTGAPAADGFGRYSGGDHMQADK